MRKYPAWFGKRVTEKGHEEFLWYLAGTPLHSVGGTRKPTVATLQGGGCLPYDISVIYLFLEGELVGEAYCKEFLHRRVSIWEATVERHTDIALKKEATARSLSSRQKIQEEANAGKRVHSLETKRLEKQRQLDLQRHEIHPSHVQATLQALKEQQTPSSLPTSKSPGLLPPAVPEDDPPGTAVVHLRVRKLRREDD